MNVNVGNPTNRRIRVGMLLGSASVAGGGVVEAVAELSRALGSIGDVDVTVFAPDDGREQFDFGSAPVVTAKVKGPAAFGYAPGLVKAILDRDVDVLHVHGLWMYISIASQIWARATGRPYIVSPHGMLDEWALRNSRSKKRIARLLFEDRHLSGAACLHVLCASEGEAIRKAGFDCPVATVPNGVAVAHGNVPPASWRRLMAPGEKALLFLGRVTPKKMVVDLVEAFGREWQAGDPWHLVIVGPASDDYLSRVRGAIADRVRDRIHLVGPAYGPERASAYASADAFVLPSVSEGLPMAALEAFSYGLPALLSPACNLPAAFAADAALEIAPDVEGIMGGLQRLFLMRNDRLRTMGGNARALAHRNFDWEKTATTMGRLYSCLASEDEWMAARSRSLTGRAGLPA